MALDWSQCPAVESIPGNVSGAWVLRGTRLPVSVIFENLEAGANIDNIMEWFQGLDRNQIKALIEFFRRFWQTALDWQCTVKRENLQHMCLSSRKTASNFRRRNLVILVLMDSKTLRAAPLAREPYCSRDRAS